MPADEAGRLSTLRDLRILDTFPDERFDRIVRLAAQHFDMPVARISFVDADRTWFKACIGLNAKQAPRSISICSHAIMANEVLTVRDLAADLRFRGSPQVAGKPHFRFYAGAPIVLRDGMRVGSVCLMDYLPHPDFSDADEHFLADLAEIVVHELDLHRQIETAADALSRTQTELIEARAAKQRFLATINHELNTPLNAIAGFSEVIKAMTEDNPELTEISVYSGHVLDAAERLNQLIRRVLVYTAAETTELTLDETIVDVAPTVRKCASLASGPPGEGTTFAVDVDPAAPTHVRVDEVHFTQILQEIFQNAARFARPDSTSSVAIAASTDGGLSIAVLNDSNPFASGALERAMRAFTQGDERLERRHEGLGLGLPIARALAELHGGDLTFREVEDGAVTELRLPPRRNVAD